MIVLKQIKINAKKVNNNINELIKSKICTQFKLKNDEIKSLRIMKESLDARKKPDIFYIYNIVMALPPKKESELLRTKKSGQIIIDSYEEANYKFPELKSSDFKRPIVVGSGPAGLFAAYFLAKEGFRPILVERGSKMSVRKEKVNEYFKNRILDPESNVQFGEGGAGTFSDGKLNTGTKDKVGMHKKVLEIFVKHGASPAIMYENKPHIGTDVLENVVVSMRNEIIRCGGLVLFNSKLTDFRVENGKITSVILNDSDEIISDRVILAIGHSARDTFKLLSSKKLNLESKPFAVGVRVIHEQRFINEAQYGKGNDFLPAADYKITTHTSGDRGVYSFCMCPGGYVVPAASANCQSVVNGMSYSKRDSKYANSAMVVTVNSNDFPDEGIFSGMNFQEELERKSYEIASGMTPVQSVKSFINNVAEDNPETLFNTANESVLGDVMVADVRSIFPENISKELAEGVILSDKKIAGFSDNIKLIAGVETRTSSPVKILRDDNYESNIKGIYPCGEGAGYAGGIMSAAVDGIRVAAAVANNINGD